ncbi:hypothetical protein protein, putative [Babesia ovis]|uniref:Uncharacterized protein n=1 Tax=Babesia ovis TaxID=5869 RepID=A0A9W5TEE8_BABOV|nr:hypothetical protein protein, putative [Babesia ovis]
MVPLFFCAASWLTFFLFTGGVTADMGRRDDTPGVIEEFEAVVSVDDDLAAQQQSDPNAYIRDLRQAIAGKASLDPEKVYTAQAMLPVGEMLVLATASGCSLLSDPVEEPTGRVEPLEFSFSLSDLDECSKVAESIITGLQAEIAAEWGHLGGTAGENEMASSTSLQDIGMRTNNRASERSSADDMTIGVQEMANAFLAANLEIKFIPTTAEGVMVMHFDLTDNTSAKEITEMMSNVDAEKLKSVNDALRAAHDKIVNASPEELQQMEAEIKSFYERHSEQLRQEVEQNRSMLEELSSDSVSEIECSTLDLDNCASVSKCSVVKLNGKETCAISPKTVFLLMETGCGLQSKAGLMSIVRDFVNTGLMTEANHQTLRQSFDLGHICNAIVHTYMSADIAETEHHESKRGFEL